MTAPADLVLTNAEVHTLCPPADHPLGDGPGDEVYEAVAIRDGRIVRVDSAYEVDFLVGASTTVIDCAGRVVLPGFVDAHTHLESTGKYLVHADLSDSRSLDAAVETLREDHADGREWWLGFGWDESGWPEGRYLQKGDLDRVAEDRPVAAIRVDMHTAALNSVALDRLAEDLPEDLVEHDDAGDPTGVIFEEAIDAVWEDIDGGRADTRELVEAARDKAHAMGVTAVHDKPGNPQVTRVCHDLAREGALGLRVRIDYRDEYLDAVEGTGLRTDAGGDWVRMGGIKSFTDGSFGGRTAKLTEPYADVDPDEREDDGRGQWLTPPEEMAALIERVDGNDLQAVTHAIGDEANHVIVDIYAETEAPGAARHRVEHVELLDDAHLETMAETGIVASCQPNFLQWAGDGGLYDQRLGEARRRRSNRFGDLVEAGVPLAFGSDSMPMDPLLGVHLAVDAPDERQRLPVTDALRAYTLGGAYAGFDEGRMGTLERGKLGDLVVLEDSPWERTDAIDAIDVALTVVDGEVVFEDR